MSGLPGEDLIREGLADLAAGAATKPAMLVLIGAPRLRRLGLRIPDPPAGWFTTPGPAYPEHRLYELLALDGADAAHSRYNSLVRTLVSFERAAECAR